MVLSIAIPTYGRDSVLIDTIGYLLELKLGTDEILVIDQTEQHDSYTSNLLEEWNNTNKIVWIRIQFPSIVRAMNIALRRAKGQHVLFLDDDIIPDGELLEVHRECASKYMSHITAGRVLQPWHKGNPDRSGDPFLFNSLAPRDVTSFMGGNVLIPRDMAIGIGGFDNNFVRVAYHFEAEFAYRWVQRGYRIRYEPEALIHHLKTERGGTRTYGEHLTTLNPDHSVGRYYYYFCTNSLTKSICISCKYLMKSVITKHHLRNPHWIPLTLIAEVKGFLWAIALYSSGRGLISNKNIYIMVIASHPIQYTTPIYRRMTELAGCNTQVLYLTIPDSKSQSLGFNKEFEWDIPLLEGYDYQCVTSEYGKGLAHGFFGVKLRKPFKDLKKARDAFKADVILFTGWHFYGMLQIFFALIFSNIPIILRMDSNGMKTRSKINRWVYKKLLSFVKIGLVVGSENRDFCLSLGMKSSQILLCPHVVDNQFFSERASLARERRDQIRKDLMIPHESYCFVFAGKLQDKKRPLDVLQALNLIHRKLEKRIHLLIVGTGKLEEECINYANVHELPVTFRGFLNQTMIPEAYGISDCIILPSGDDETWGLVINEAMSSRLPAIVSDKVGCARDLVEDGYTGFTYPSGDIKKLADLMRYMAEHIELSKQMGFNAELLIKSKYSLDQAVIGISNAVGRILGKVDFL